MSQYEPLVRVDADGSIISTAAGTMTFTPPSSIAVGSTLMGPPTTIATHTADTAGQPDSVVNGTLAPGSFATYEPITLTAGVTYSFNERGLQDTFLLLYDTTGHLITYDDDGGFGHSSLITYTPTVSGTYYLGASSWYHVDPSAPGYNTADSGNFSISVWQADAAHDVGSTFATAAHIGVGTTYGQLEAPGDRDMYQITLTAGQLYNFTYAGGIASDAEFSSPQPGENVGILRLYDAAGNLIAAKVDYETNISYMPQQSGTYYLRVDPYTASMTGGYTIDVRGVNPADYNPLDSINWRSAANITPHDVNGVPTAYVYFGHAGENFGEKADDGVTPMTTYGWQQFQIDGVMSALQQYTAVTGINYVITNDSSQATFRLLTTRSSQYGAYAYPQDPAYGTQQGILVFNLRSGGFTLPESLQPGGYSYEVILHEMGHAHGLAHPHDNGGGSDVMLGVNSYSDLGIYDLNQGAYTVMSYNDGWASNPEGAQPFSRATVGYGWDGNLSAFDVAELQQRGYGPHANNAGDTVYNLPDSNGAGTYFQTIYDTGGNDTIAYSGTRDVHIDLLAATLDYTETGGGVVSWAEGVKGGYTIANGTVIENATGGSGNDILIGNSANNTLIGNGGNDTLLGRAGDDRIIAGAGDDKVVGGDGLDVVSLGAGHDIFVAEVTPTKVNLKQGAMSVDIITDWNGADDLIDVSGLGTAMNFRGTSNNSRVGDLTYKVYDSVNGAEHALGFDIHSRPGAGGIGGPVTVVFGNTDGGNPDFAVVLLHTSGIAANNFMYAATADTTVLHDYHIRDYYLV